MSCQSIWNKKGDSIRFFGIVRSNKAEVTGYQWCNSLR